MRFRRRRGGFTLIELAAVVLVISLLYGFVLPNIGIGRRRALDGEAEGLRAGLELARQRSIATGARHRVALDLDGARYHLERFEIPAPEPRAEPDAREPIDLAAPRSAAGGFERLPTRHGRDQRLADGVHFGTVETSDGHQRNGVVGVEFFQDGSATPTRIALETDEGDALELEVLPLADTVRVHVVR